MAILAVAHVAKVCCHRRSRFWLIFVGMRTGSPCNEREMRIEQAHQGNKRSLRSRTNRIVVVGRSPER
jgi:hypothetical protein